MTGKYDGEKGRILAKDNKVSGRILYPNSDEPMRGLPRDSDVINNDNRIWFFVFVISLSMFGQVFHYVIDVQVLYYLSKIWPFIVMPAVFLGIKRVRTQYDILFVATIAYSITITPVMSMIYFGNEFVDAFATTLKAWPLSYYFAFLAILCVLKPEPDRVGKAFLIYGLLSWLLLCGLWIVVPASAYVSDPAQSRLFLYDMERGYRIFLPLFFGMFALFFVTEKAFREKKILYLVLSVACIISMILIFKQRTQIAVSIIVIGWILFSNLQINFKSIYLFGLTIISFIALGLILGPFNYQFIDSFGASLSVRQKTMALAISYISQNPLMWIFGVGSITRFSDVTMFDIFGYEMFYLADIGWVGIVFEYGVIGGLLILGIYLAGVWEALRRPTHSVSAFEAAFGYLALYLIIVTLVYPPMYAPGEIAITVAVLVYYRLFRGSQMGSGHARQHDEGDGDRQTGPGSTKTGPA